MDSIKDNFKVALVYHACPICGSKADESVIMNQKLTKKEADKVAELDHKIIGLSENACEECVNRKDEMFFVTCHKTNNNHIKFKYCGIKHTSDFKNEIKDYINTTKNGVEFVVCDEETFDAIIHSNDN